uniref:G-protein coupled receptors family 1 profile domain-containing protein n=1 Tax=Amphimedon queenslandica TaxID=400682 RepID=A0A1X7TUK7_AMPQE
MEGNFTFTGQFSGPAVAAVLTFEMILALIANGLVLSITLYQRKSLKQSSTIFFTSLILAHLVLNLLYLPFTIIALAAGEWIFGNTDEEKIATCTFTAFLYSYTIRIIFMTLAAISFDRFLFIVKPYLHKWFMRPWVALTLTIAIWILSAVLSSAPFYGLNEYVYDDQLLLCYQRPNSTISFIFYVLFPCVTTAIIIVTSLWTFCFAGSFFKDQSVIAGESVYASKKKRLFGVFGSMLFIYGICIVPGLVLRSLQEFIDVPPKLSISSMTCFLFITIASPIIQSYFRPEIKSVLASRCPLLFTCACCKFIH